MAVIVLSNLSERLAFELFWPSMYLLIISKVLLNFEARLEFDSFWLLMELLMEVIVLSNFNVRLLMACTVFSNAFEGSAFGSFDLFDFESAG